LGHRGLWKKLQEAVQSEHEKDESKNNPRDQHCRFH